MDTSGGERTGEVSPATDSDERVAWTGNDSIASAVAPDLSTDTSIDASVDSPVDSSVIDGPGPVTISAEEIAEANRPDPIEASLIEVGPIRAEPIQAGPTETELIQADTLGAGPAGDGPVGTEVAPVPHPAPAAPAAPMPHPAPPPPAPAAEVPVPAEVPEHVGPVPESFGRIDADGTVYVRVADGERVVGSWQAGTPAEGIAHFTRRYADVRTEVELLEARLASGAADAGQTKGSAARIRASLDTAAVVGDLDALAARLDTLIELAGVRAAEQRTVRAAAREEAAARKRTLVEEAEQIAADSTQWKAAGDRMHQILDEWKTIRGVDRKLDTELWRRYAAARDGFNRRRGSHFAGLDSQRKAIQHRKEELVTEAESLTDSTDWAPTAARLKQLMADWKTIGRAPREAEEQLWKRFRAAQDAFFAHRSTVFGERDSEFRTNQARKEELLAAAEAIDPNKDLKAAQAALRDIQTRWEDIGRVPREAMASLDRRLRTLDERIRTAAEAEWRRGAAESNPLLSQVREQVAKAEKQLERARIRNDARAIAAAEKALESRRHILALAEGND